MPPGIGISLLDAPVARKDDPRALVYIVDHLQGGTTITRRLRVSNGTDEPATLRLFVGAADIGDGTFRILDGRPETDLTSWSRVEPSEITLQPQTAAPATVTIEVPPDAADGEHYGAVVAELPGDPDAGPITLAQRVGIRIYLSVGDGAEPETAFEIDSLAAGRDDDGRPVVRASVRNTGGRAVDLRAELELLDGPGGVTAGPFAARVPATLAPGDEAPVTVTLDAGLPAGPWRAVITVRSGNTERTAEAGITFPEAAGTFDDPVKADEVDRQRRTLAPIAAGLAALVAAGIVVYAVKAGGVRRLVRRTRRHP